MSEHIKNMADSCGQTAENESLATSRDSLKIWADVLNYGKQVLKDAGIAEADLDSWYLFEQIFGISRAQYFMCARDRITDRAAQGKSVPEHSADRVKCGNSSEENPDPLKQKLDAYDAALKKRASHIPLQQIIGQQEFMGLSFFVNEHVLIPRQDTETLVELVLNEQKDRNCSILDMCTGSGCIAISLKKLGGYRHVEGADISEEALKVARKNAEDILGMDRDTELVSVKNCADIPERNWQNLSNNQNKYDNFANSKLSGALDISNSSETVNFRRTDMFRAFQPSEKFDVIVSNPPYIPSAVIEELEPEVRDHEPRGALDGTADGLYFYRILAEECGKHLTPGGHVYFEIGYDQGAAVKELLDAHGFQDTKVIKDLPGKDRVVCGTWQVAGV